jgi:uncharacterized membrane protein HdeD (DUF308 family)
MQVVSDQDKERNTGKLASEPQEAARMWWLLGLLGLASVAAGIVLVLRPSNSLQTLAVVFGIFLVLDGIVALLSSLAAHTEHRALAAIIGVLGIVVGIALIRHPLHGVNAIGLLIGLWLVAGGAVRVVRALTMSARPVLQLMLAVLELIVGIVIVSDPHIGYTALAVITGIWLILNGIGTAALGFTLHAADREHPASGSA